MNIPPKYEDVVAQLAVARADLTLVKNVYIAATTREVVLQQRLTVAEQRAGELEGLLKGSLESVKFDLEKVESREAETYLVALISSIESALKPAVEGEGK